MTLALPVEPQEIYFNQILKLDQKYVHGYYQLDEVTDKMCLVLTR